MASRTSTPRDKDPGGRTPVRPKVAGDRASTAGTSDADLVELPGMIGAQVADQVAVMRQVMSDVRNARSITRAQVTILEQSLKVANRIAMHSQQLSRLGGGRLRQSHERLALHDIVQDVIDGMAAQCKAGGFEVSHRLNPVEVIVDPGLLVSLVQIAMEWSLARGRCFQVSLNMLDMPAHADLTMKSRGQSAGTAVGADERVMDDLDWHLLMQLAQAMGVSVDRTVAADYTVLSIRFPRTVRQLEGLTAVEMHGPNDSTSFMTEANPFAGHRVLAIVADQGTVDELRAVCKNMALVMDVCASSSSAVRFCELEKPHMIVVEKELRDQVFEALRHDLKRSDINFPIVEVTRELNVLEMSDWMGDSVSRISRGSLQSQLSPLLVMELAKVS